MGMVGLPKPLFGNNNIDKIILRSIFEDMTKGVYPKFGSPETKCSKCMFCGVVCAPNPEYSGCYSGWKREEEI
jgi:hypothetical protein